MKKIPVGDLGSMVTIIVNSTNAFVAQTNQTLTALRAAPAADGIVDDAVLSDLCLASRCLAAEMHRIKMFFDWSVAPTPEWFDHFIDQHYQFRERMSSFFVERGVYGILALQHGGDFLELCCGDGYNTRHFYAPFANRVTAVDFDETAIKHAKTYNSSKNIEFQLANIISDMPWGVFSNIIWDAAIEHFTEQEIATVMANIKARLSANGILSGYTLVEKADGTKHLHQHEREFHSKEDLADFLKPFFKNVMVFETMHPTRHNLYFYASDGVIPFADSWPHALRIHHDGAAAGE